MEPAINSIGCFAKIVLRGTEGEFLEVSNQNSIHSDRIRGGGW